MVKKQTEEAPHVLLLAPIAIRDDDDDIKTKRPHLLSSNKQREERWGNDLRRSPKNFF